MRTEDGSIINECLGGKPQAFGMLVDKYKAGVYAYVCAEVRNFHDAQDITQEVFIQAYRDLRSLRKWESFTFWLYRIAYTRCKIWVSRRRRRWDSLCHWRIGRGSDRVNCGSIRSGNRHVDQEG